MDNDDFLVLAGNALELLSNVSESEYWADKLPSTIDAKIAKMCTLYMQATLIQRQVLSSSFTRRMSFNLSIFSTRMAMLGVRQRREDMLLDGLIALVMILDWLDADVREVLMDLSVIYNSAAKIGNPGHLFHTVVQYAVEDRTKRVILNYITRSPEDKQIEMMGWQEIDGPNGLIYRFGQQPIPEGHL